MRKFILLLLLVGLLGCGVRRGKYYQHISVPDHIVRVRRVYCPRNVDPCCSRKKCVVVFYYCNSIGEMTKEVWLKKHFENTFNPTKRRRKK